MLTSAEIRQQFLAFFEGKGHTIVDSSPVVPHDDPTLMFTNAGMNQFKDVFLGTGSRPYLRATDTQKCIRAGGKHNDLDDVGQDTYHHTFFEMLGNWSFGDYFKREAISWAWELLTGVWGIDKTRLYATVFEGNEADGLPPDTEAQELWKEVTDIDPSHVTCWGKKDNFWEMGDTGPCGPCSEIHIDLTPDKSGGSLVNAGDPRVIELWNLVFIELDSFVGEGDGTQLLKTWDECSQLLETKQSTTGFQSREQILSRVRRFRSLPAKHVDTGMGFERLCAVLQGMQAGDLRGTTNYDTDVFGSLFDAIRKRTGAPKYTGTLPVGEEGTKGLRDQGKKKGESSPSVPQSLNPSDPQILINVTYRVIADHVRCLTFALTDGATPDNEGRGYVLRRILRRAVRYGRQYLEMHEPFMCDLVAPLIDDMADAFPELRTAHGGKNVEHVTELIRDEETSFLKTLDRGIRFWWQAALAALQKAAAPEWRLEGPTPDAGQGGHVGEVTTATIFRSDIDTDYTLSDRDGNIVRIRYDWLTSDLMRKIGVSPIIGGPHAFTLHDTYGFPIDLTEQMAEERGLTVDIAEYEKLMEKARQRTRFAGKWPLRYILTVSLRTAVVDNSSRVLGQIPCNTDDSDKYSSDTISATIKRIACIEGDSAPYAVGLPDCVIEGTYAAIITDRTCFYGEQGGQVGDKGTIRSNGSTFRVLDTLNLDRAVVHIGEVTKGRFASGEVITMTVEGSRVKTKANHTSTHIMNWALREVLGEHVQQKGSLVDPEKTRFDFSNRGPLTDEQIVQVEQLCCEQIEADHQVYTQEVDQGKAREINTLRAVFGEKYPDVVRVVSIGADIDEMLADPKNPEWMKYSVEFCGGTHLKRSGEAEQFVLISEEGVSKGVRRVVGITGKAAIEATQRAAELIDALDHRWAGPGDDVEGWLREFQTRLDEAIIPLTTKRTIRNALKAVKQKNIAQTKIGDFHAGIAVREVVATLLESAEEVGGVTVVVGEVPQAPADQVRGAIDWVRQKCEASAVLLAMAGDGRVTLLAGMSRKAVERGLKAGDLIREIAPIVGGKGGGKPDLAQGGGKDPSKIPDALDRARSWLKSKLGPT